MAPKALLLRIGIDSNYGGTLAPIYPDGSFEYIPIPESNDEETTESRTYYDIAAREEDSLAELVPDKTADKRVHLDPEFDTYTYADPTKKRQWLANLQADDLLVFYAGLKPHNQPSSGGNPNEKGLYIIGYFTIDDVVDFQTTNRWTHYREEYPNNAHMKRQEEPEDLLLVSGNPSASAKLDEAIKISKTAQDSLGRRYYVASDELENHLGVSGKLQQSIPPRWIEGSSEIDYLRSLLL